MYRLIYNKRIATTAAATSILVASGFYSAQSSQLPSLSHNNNRRATCDGSIASPPSSFDTKGFQLYKNIPSSQCAPLVLTGVGMRRKNLYIVEVDVYLCGLNLSPIALQNARKLSTSSLQSSELVDAILKRSDPKVVTPSTLKNPYRALITLRFVRAVTKTQIVEAFNDAFAGCTLSDISLFKDKLGKSVGDTGLAVGDELQFLWKEDGGLVITREDGKYDNLIESAEIEHRLLQVYLDPKKTVSPELVKTTTDNVLLIK